jgi:hypothetical protein
MIKPKIVFIAFCLSINISSCAFIKEQITLEFTTEQCSVVKSNFDKLKIGMNKNDVIPLIGGKRVKYVLLNPKHFSEQKNVWEIWPLCYDSKSCINSNSESLKCYEWQMIAFDTVTGKVVKIFSADPEITGFF